MFTDKEKDLIKILQKAGSADGKKFTPELRARVWDELDPKGFTYIDYHDYHSARTLRYMCKVFMEFNYKITTPKESKMYINIWTTQTNIVRHMLRAKSPLFPDKFLLRLAHIHLSNVSTFRCPTDETLLFGVDIPPLILPKELHQKFEGDPNIKLTTLSEVKTSRRDEDLAKEKEADQDNVVVQIGGFLDEFRGRFLRQDAGPLEL